MNGKILTLIFLISLSVSCTVRKLTLQNSNYIAYAEALCLDGKIKLAFDTLINSLISDNSYSIQTKIDAIYLNHNLNSITQNISYSEAIKNQIVTTYCSYYPFPDKNKIISFIDLYLNDQLTRKNYSMAKDRKLDNIDSFVNKFIKTDSFNMLKFNQLFLNYNLDSFLALGKFPTKVLFYLIVHNKLEYQIKYYPLLDSLTQKGYLAKYDLALLEDVMLLNSGSPQKYGLKLGYLNENQYYYQPVLSVDSVNYYRKTMGIKPHQDTAYLFELNQDTIFFIPSNK